MKPASFYNVAFTWLKQSATQEQVRGSVVESFTPQLGYLYGNLDLQSASEEDEYGAIRSKVTGVIRLRGIPGIKSEDRLTDGWGREWRIDGRIEDHKEHETIMDVHQYDQKAGL